MGKEDRSSVEVLLRLESGELAVCGRMMRNHQQGDVEL